MINNRSTERGRPSHLTGEGCQDHSPVTIHQQPNLKHWSQHGKKQCHGEEWGLSSHTCVDQSCAYHLLAKQLWPSDLPTLFHLPSVKGGQHEDKMRSEELEQRLAVSMSITICCSYFSFLNSPSWSPFSHTSFKLICYHSEQITFLTRSLWGRYIYLHLNSEKPKTDPGFRYTWAHILSLRLPAWFALISQIQEGAL